MEAQVPHGKILVIDDEAPIVKAMIRSLAEQGYQVLGAGNYEQACRILSYFKPDVILLDLSMPDPNGIDILKSGKLGELAEGAKIMVVSAAPEDILGKTLDIGAHDTLSKPFTGAVLCDKLSALLPNPI